MNSQTAVSLTTVKPPSAPHTFLLSWAASSFFWISSSEGFWRGGVVALSSGPPSKVGGFKMTSKAWPLVRLLSSITSMSRMLHRFKSTTPAAARRAQDSKLTTVWHRALIFITLMILCRFAPPCCPNTGRFIIEQSFGWFLHFKINPQLLQQFRRILQWMESSTDNKVTSSTKTEVLLTFLLVSCGVSGLGEDAGAEERHQGELSHLLSVC